MWALCLFWLSMLLAYRVLLVGDGPNIDSLPSVSWFVVVMYTWPVVCTVALRWFVIPRIKTFSLTIIPFFLGIVLAMSLAFYGIYLFEGFLTVFFVTACLATLQFIPLFNLNRG